MYNSEVNPMVEIWNVHTTKENQKACLFDSVFINDKAYMSPLNLCTLVQLAFKYF